jgi:hypothetical protein
VWTLTRLSRLYWRQSLLLIVAVLLPSVANVANLNLGPFRHVEPTPFLFVLTRAVLVWGLFRFRLLGLAPIATNVRMHAAATQVAVRLEEAQGGLLVTIGDDGAGFDPDRVKATPRPGHVGLTSMSERATMADGWCRVDSHPGSGTTVRF